MAKYRAADGLSRLRGLLAGGDRRSIAQSARARSAIEKNPALVAELATLADDDDPLVVMRAFDLLEKFAHEHPEWIEPHKQLFIGPHAQSDRWEIRLQIVRALPLFEWSADDLKRAEAILIENVTYPQSFVRAWALNSLATFAEKNASLRPIVIQHLREFERTDSKALQARAKAIREHIAYT